MRKLNAVAALAWLALNVGCATSLAHEEYLGGWTVTDDIGVEHARIGGTERFTLQRMLGRDTSGKVVGWSDLTVLYVPLRRDERTMFGMECVPTGTRDFNVIAVVQNRDDDRIVILRAWKIDIADHVFITVNPRAVTCESLE